MAIAFGILGATASILGLLIPANGRRERFIHLAYGAIIVLLAYGVVTYQEKIDRIASIERAATTMVNERNMKYTHLGFVQATLAFLEKNQDLYPDTYRRAQSMCSQYVCDRPEGDSADMVGLAFAMSGILRGIATLDTDS